MKPSEKPIPAQRTVIINWLKARGLSPSVVSTIVTAGKTRGEITMALVDKLKALPKAKKP